jgi:hypothetical protein
MANAHERFLRPAGNYSDSRDLSNWNTKKGG